MFCCCWVKPRCWEPPGRHLCTPQSGRPGCVISIEKGVKPVNATSAEKILVRKRSFPLYISHRRGLSCSCKDSKLSLDLVPRSYQILCISHHYYGWNTAVRCQNNNQSTNYIDYRFNGRLVCIWPFTVMVEYKYSRTKGAYAHLGEVCLQFLFSPNIINQQ